MGRKVKVMKLFLLVSISEIFTFSYCLTSHENSPKKRSAVSLKYLYVGKNGGIHRTKTSGYWLTVEATSGVDEQAHLKTALITSRLTRHMPSSIFHMLCLNAKVGVFTKADGMTAFLEYAHQKDTPQCHRTCAGICSHTCTSDGRKISELVGGSGHGLAAVLEDNVMCSDSDPYHGQSNVLVHEIAHIVHRRALPDLIKTEITNAFQTARRNNTWARNSYAMTNEMEYFAEAVSSFFHVERLQSAAGGMNTCGRVLCHNETESRKYIKERDPKLYQIINYVYLNHNETILANLGNCVT